MSGSALHALLGPVLVSLGTQAFAGQPSGPAESFPRDVERCIVPAANYHRVNAQVLRAILVVESGLNPRALAKNANGTLDVGMGQMNSIHFRELGRYGIAPAHLLDPCVSTYVTAWHLRKVMDQAGNTWEGIARYHSASPYFNSRYQILLHNELVRSQVIRGRLIPVPQLSLQPKARGRKVDSHVVPAAILVFDSQSTER
jgi:soluble lytic murein transglycosylase-like protein